MDISAKSWRLGNSYEKDDIVKVDNLSLPNDIDKFMSSVAEGDRLISEKSFDCLSIISKIIDEEGSEIAIDPSGGFFSKKILVSQSSEIPFGFIFSIDPSIAYTFKAYVRKDTSISETIDAYLTNIQTLNGSIDQSKSIGVGVGVKFFDNEENFIEVEDYRPLVRPMASSELSESEYYNVQLDVDPKHIPDNAAKAQAYVFVYGHREGGFEFRDIRSTSVNQFFYCVENHQSNTSNYPSASKNWTQNFIWRPSYGSSGSYKAANELMELGEGYDYVNNLAINSLPLELDVRFNNRTDKEAKAIIHFLQEKHFPYESIYALDYKGERLLSTDVQAFNFVYSFPYRKDLKFTCVEFNHSIDYRNNNSISAKFICNTESTLRSVESHAGYNLKTDAILPIRVNEEIKLEKGKTIKLDTFSVDEDSKEDLNSLTEIYVYKKDEDGKPNSGVLLFREPQELSVNDCIYIEVNDPEDSIFSIGFAKIFKAIDNKTFIFGNGEGFVVDYFEESVLTDFGKNVQLDSCEKLITDPIPRLVLKSKLLESGDPSDVGNYLGLTTDPEEILEDNEDRVLVVTDKTKDAPATVSKLKFCPQDCLAANAIFPEGCDVITKDFIDKTSGEKIKRILHLSNYVQLELESDIGKDSYSFSMTPLSNFTLKSGENYNIIVPAVCGRSSIYLEEPEKIAKFPYYKVRNFEHRPTFSFNLSHKPKHTESNFLEYYNKKYKKSINQNLSAFNVVFDMRDDEEALEILQFLESHLGYKKFRFVMPRPYGTDTSSLTTPGRSNNSVFYCPDWQHNIVYKNNHLISATFIESTTNIQEDVSNIEEPCFGVTLYDNVNKHALCTFSSVAIAKIQSIQGDMSLGSIGPKRKSTDVIFIIDTTGSMTYYRVSGANYSYSKYQAAMDVVRKMVTAYDDFIMPGTLDYGGLINSPTKSQTEPPWPVNSSLETILDHTQPDIRQDLISKGYDPSDLEKFMIKIERDRVNFGVLLMGHGNGTTVIDVSSQPDSFDKKNLYDVTSGWVNSPVQYGQGEAFTDAISKALAQLYNSRRAQDVSERIIIMLSDGVQTRGDWTGGGWNRYSPSSLAIAEQLRSGGELTQRRPSDDILAKYGYGAVTPLNKINSYSTQNNPDTQGSNPSWYSEEVPTTFMFAQMGNPNYMSRHNPEYVYDYDSNEPNKSPEFFFSISDKSGADEVNRLLALISAVSKITSDNGFENIFSISIKNCGPYPIKILNSIVNLKNETQYLKWTTDVLMQGIPLGGNHRDVTEIDQKNNVDNIKVGQGGQYFGDPNNRSFMHDPAFGDEQSNGLWENFNTKYEVIREGVPYEINGGWNRDKKSFLIATDSGEVISTDLGDPTYTDGQGLGPYKTRGVYNTGVAFKGMPIRVFKSEKGMEVIDYNIGGIDTSNLEADSKGNYDHIPVLQKGEVIDLFFGVRIGNLSNIGDELEIVFNTEDHTDKKMDCYARVNVPITVEDMNISEEPPEPPEPSIPDPENCNSVWMDNNFTINHPDIGEIGISVDPPLGNGIALDSNRFDFTNLEDFPDYPGDGASFQMSNVTGEQRYVFDKPVLNPILAIYSLGDTAGRTVTITCSATPYDYSGGAAVKRHQKIIIDSENKTITGTEGYGMVSFAGTFTEITLSPDVPEHYYNTLWGVQYCG